MAPKVSSEGKAPVRATLEVPGGRLAYATAGHGTPVVFVHSVIADSRMWDRELTRLAPRYRTIRYDLRGFGGSSAATSEFSYTADLRALLAHLNAGPAWLVGSSMGGAIAINFALAHPELVRGLVLAAPGLSGGVEPPFDAEEKAALEYDDKKSQEVNQAWTQGDRAAAFERLRELWCSALKGPNLALFRTMVDENAAEVFGDRSAQHAARDPPAEGRLGGVRVPATVLVGDRDNPSMPLFARRVARGIPGARLVKVPGADHLVNLSQPEGFDRALTDALSGTS